MKTNKSIKKACISSIGALALTLFSGSFMPEDAIALPHNSTKKVKNYSHYMPPSKKGNDAYTATIKFPFCHARGTRNEKSLFLSGTIYTGKGLPFRLSFKEKYEAFAFEFLNFFMEEWDKSVGKFSWKELSKEKEIKKTLSEISQTYIKDVLPRSYGGEKATAFLSVDLEKVDSKKDEICKKRSRSLDINLELH